MAEPVAIPTTHRAWTFTRRGPRSETLRLTTDYPTPQASSLRKNEALIKVSAVSLNAGQLLLFALPHFTSSPWIPEMDFAGTIVALGPQESSDAKEVKVGDRVLGARSLSDAYRHNGALQEYLVASLDQVAKIPATTTFADASGFAACGAAAIQALHVADVKRGHKVLITGGSSGLGSLLVQVAKAVVGETGVVVATTSGKNEELVRSLGADETIDYTKHRPLAAYLKEHHSNTPFDAIFDIVNDTDEVYKASPAYLKQSGRFVLLGGLKVIKDGGNELATILGWGLWVQFLRLRPRILGGTPRSYQFYSGKPNKKDAESFLELVEAGKVRAVVDSHWKFEQVHEAYEKLASQRAKGKVVVDFDL